PVGIGPVGAGTMLGSTQPPIEQTCPIGHCVPQPPQLALSLSVSMHAPEQFTKAEPPWHLQAPNSQTSPPSQATLHWPQLLVSVLMSTQPPLHSIVLPVQPPAMHMPAWQTEP